MEAPHRACDVAIGLRSSARQAVFPCKTRMCPDGSKLHNIRHKHQLGAPRPFRGSPDKSERDTPNRDSQGRVFGCEYSAELGYGMFRLTNVGLKCVPTDAEAGYRVTDFAKRVHERFTRFFTPGYAWVPYGGPSFFLGQLCAAEGAKREYAQRHLRELSDWGVYPAVRLNYRDHGLDSKSAEIIAEACNG